MGDDPCQQFKKNYAETINVRARIDQVRIARACSGLMYEGGAQDRWPLGKFVVLDRHAEVRDQQPVKLEQAQ